MELIDFAEDEALKNANFHIESADALQRESNTLASLVFAGGGVLLGFSIVEVSSFTPDWQAFTIAVTSAYLFFIGGVTSIKCLWARELYPPTNEPAHLIQDNCEALAIRRACLKNKQSCIDLNKSRNDTVGKWLNIVRCMTALTPLVSFAAYLVAGGH